MQTKNEFLLGIDPGSYKTGVAKVKPDGEVISAEWVETQTLTEVLTKLNAESKLSAPNGWKPKR